MAKLRLPKIDLSTPLAKKKATVVLLTACAAFIGVITLTFSYFTTSGFCNFCHSMNPQFESWQKSSHAQIPCMACHLPPGGGLMLIKDHVMAGKLVAAEFVTGYEKPINAESAVSQEHIEVEQCERCHNLETRVVTPRPSLTMTSKAHIKHLDAGLRCTTCHNRVTHWSMDDKASKIEYEKEDKSEHFEYENFMDMKKGCLRCHNAQKPFTGVNGATAPSACTTCHPGKWEGLPIGHSGDWRSNHKATAQNKKYGFGYCLGNKSVDGKTPGCHAANEKFNFKEDKPFCVQCHDEPKVSTFVNAAAKDI